MMPRSSVTGAEPSLSSRGHPGEQASAQPGEMVMEPTTPAAPAGKGDGRHQGAQVVALARLATRFTVAARISDPNR